MSTFSVEIKSILLNTSTYFNYGFDFIFLY